MKATIEALYDQFKNCSDLDYVQTKRKGENPIELITLNKFPFVNISPGPGSITISKVDNLSFSDAERHTFKISIEFATKSLKLNVALMGDDDHNGLLDLQGDLWDAIRADTTLGGVVKGITPGSTIDSDVLEEEGENKCFIARGQMTIEFIKDVFLK